MALQHLGSLTLGQCVPYALRASAQLKLTLDLVLPSLQAKLAAALKLQLSLTITPPSLGLQLEAALKLVAALRASISLNLPGVNFQLAAVAKLIAALQLDLGKLSLGLSFQLELDLLLGTPGMHAYFYTGLVSGLGNELAGATQDGFPGGRGEDECAVWIFGASDGGAITAGRALFVAA